MAEQDPTQREAEAILASGMLGRTRSYARLLEYLVQCSAEERAPKEIEIAAEVFGKGADFDPSQDSLVRVYAHNLRQKIDHYYATAGRDAERRLTIPRGEYRVVLAPRESATPPGSAPANGGRLGLGNRSALGWAATSAVLAIALVAVLVTRGDGHAADKPLSDFAASPVWSSFLDDDLPTLVVVGDYYIFGEVDKSGDVQRLVRDFDINSSRDLDNLLMHEPSLIGRYIDLDLTYLPRASALVLRDVLRVLYTSSKPVRIIAMSELNVADLKTNHVIYIGYISALDKLMDFVFASSGLTVGSSYDELINKSTGQLYSSGAALPRTDQRHYRDYGLFSTFPGPGGNQLMIIAGTRDTGLMQTAYAVTDPTHLKRMQQSVVKDGTDVSPTRPAFEVLYEVTGFDGTNLDAMLVYSAPLDYRTIWGGDLTQLSSNPTP